MSAEQAGGTPGSGAVSERMRALLARAAEEQLHEQRQVSAVLGELRALLEDVDERLATGEQVEQVAGQARELSARVEARLDQVDARSAELAERISEATALVGQAAQDLVAAVVAGVAARVEVQLRELTAGTERRLATHVDDAVLALAEVVLRRRSAATGSAAPASDGGVVTSTPDPPSAQDPTLAGPAGPRAPTGAPEPQDSALEEPLAVDRARSEPPAAPPEDLPPGELPDEVADPPDAAADVPADAPAEPPDTAGEPPVDAPAEPPDTTEEPPADVVPDAPADVHDEPSSASSAPSAEAPADPPDAEPLPDGPPVGDPLVDGLEHRDGFVLVPADLEQADAVPAPPVQHERRTADRRSAERSDGSGRRRHAWWRPA